MVRTGIFVRKHCNLDLDDMTLGLGHNTPLGHRQQLYVECYLNQTWQKEVMAQERQTQRIDGQADRNGDSTGKMDGLTYRHDI